MSSTARRVCFTLSSFLLLLLSIATGTVRAQNAPEYRAMWVDTFNTPLGSRADIDKVIASAVSSNANAIFAQIRRRGDSWYLDTLEPLTQVVNVGEPAGSGAWTLDPLQYLIAEAHLRGIEVHAFVIITAIYNAHPTITGLPRDRTHVFTRHFWNEAATGLYPDADPRQWSTRVLPHNPGTTTFNGHRFGAEWYVDLGHPDAAAYTVNVLTHLVSRYDLDGLHLDRIRYPEAPIDAPTGSPLVTWGINVGYNETSVNRFKTRYGPTATYYTDSDIGKNVSSNAAQAIISAADVGYPRTNDTLWNAWRREQVTNFVRRLYLSATAVKPRIKISAATICFWTGPTASLGWERTEAHYRVFQDWRSWMQEGILDIAAPMIYKREHTLSERNQFDDWLSFSKSLAQSTGRQTMSGLGAYLNGVEGTLRQTRRALARNPFDATNTAASGVIFYALGSTGAGAVGSTNALVSANPYSYPTAGVSTPKRTNADFFAALTTGASVSGTTLFEDPGLGPVFPTPVPTPDMPWKSSPTLGHVMGFARAADGAALDGAIVTVSSVSSPATAAATAKTDGGGFYGVVGLAPGAYRARVEQAGLRLDICRFDVTAGAVTSADARADVQAPVTTAVVNPAAPTGQNGWYLDDVTVTLDATDDCAGVTATQYSLDGGATWQPYTGEVTVSQEGTTVFAYRSTDAATNTETASTIALRIDKSNPTFAMTADGSQLWPPNGRLVPVVVSGSGTDAISGLAGATYEVVDEYGMTFTIGAHALSGASAAWTDTAMLEARREGIDRDGRTYRIIVTVRDLAGRSASLTVTVVVSHDRRQ